MKYVPTPQISCPTGTDLLLFTLSPVPDSKIDQDCLLSNCENLDKTTLHDNQRFLLVMFRIYWMSFLCSFSLLRFRFGSHTTLCVATPQMIELIWTRDVSVETCLGRSGSLGDLNLEAYIMYNVW